jgi:hypothetical protein
VLAQVPFANGLARTLSKSRDQLAFSSRRCDASLLFPPRQRDRELANYINRTGRGATARACLHSHDHGRSIWLPGELVVPHPLHSVASMPKVHLHCTGRRQSNAVLCYADWNRRARKIMVVALARKLLIALWRFVIDGVLPEGAVLKPAA